MQLSSLLDNFSWIELLFWLPTLMDLLLLAMIYGSCSYHGITWFLNSTKDDAMKKKNDDVVVDEKDLPPTVHQVWEFAMMAYSAYATLFVFAFYCCIKLPELRTSFCWAMTILMIIKCRLVISQQALLKQSDAKAVMAEKRNREKLMSLVVFYFPTYGGYAILKTFVLK